MANSPDTYRDRRKVAGMVLAVVGIALFWLNVTEGASEAVILAAIGAALVAVYFAGQGYGLLIPGCILLGLGLGDLVGAEELGLGLGFLAIYGIGRMNRGRTAWWPLVPGGIITLYALGVRIRSVDTAIDKGWPLILAAVGVALFLGWGAKRGGDDGDRGDQEPTAPRGPHESHGPHAD